MCDEETRKRLQQMREQLVLKQQGRAAAANRADEHGALPTSDTDKLLTLPSAFEVEGDRERELRLISYRQAEPAPVEESGGASHDTPWGGEGPGSRQRKTKAARWNFSKDW